MDQSNEVTIVGAGPAGIAAGIYLKRAGLHPILLESDKPGGLLRHAHLVENYPGFPHGITGKTLVESIVKQLQNLNLSIRKSEVKHIHHNNELFLIETDQGYLLSASIIIASGTCPKKIGIEGSASIEGQYLFYDPSSIPIKENKVKKRILVIGGGDIAFDYTLSLLHMGHEVIIISRSEPTCIPLLHNRILKNGATLHTKCDPEQIVKYRKNILLKCRQNDHNKEFFADFIVIACGRAPNTGFLSPMLKKYLNTISDVPRTALPGLYFAGDVVRGTYRQVGVAVGDGIRAAMMTERYLKEKSVRL
jgi:thioredoxin reductase (NADPH)